VTREVVTPPDLFHTTLKYTPGMPVTGPIAVADAQVGDFLAIEILNIELDGQGWTMAMAGRGLLGDKVTVAASRLLPITSEDALFLNRVRVPLRPMIGCVGVTPASGPLRAGWPGEHGGNFDCILLGTGATLYLPVLVPGAMLCLGDLHAAMGDGEVGVAGLEIAGTVTLRMWRLATAECRLPTPFLVNEACAATIFSAATLDEAAVGATVRMAEFLAAEAALSLADAAMLLSLVGDLRICQAVNPLKSCRLEVPRSVLADLGIELPLR
jgi:amidase